MAQTTIVDGMIVKGQHLGADYRNQQLLVNTTTSTPARAFALSEWTAGSAALTAAFQAADAAAALGVATQITTLGNRLNNIEREVLLQTSVRLRLAGSLADLQATNGFFLGQESGGQTISINATTDDAPVTNAAMLLNSVLLESPNAGEDGIYYRNMAGQFVRHTSFDTAEELAVGTEIYVAEGTSAQRVYQVVDNLFGAGASTLLDRTASNLIADPASFLEISAGQLNAGIKADYFAVAVNSTTGKRELTLSAAFLSRISDLEADVLDLQAGVQANATNIAGNANAIAQLGTSVSQQGTTLGNLGTTVSNQGATLTTNTNDIAALQTAIQGVATLAAVRTLLGQMKKVLVLTGGVFDAVANTTTFVVGTGWTSASFWVNGVREAGAPYESTEDPKMEVIADPVNAAQFAVRLTFSGAVQIANNTLSVGVELYDPAGLPA